MTGAPDRDERAEACEERPDWTAGGFGVYVHWPYCLAKCPYCDFNSHVARTIDHAAMERALLEDLTYARALSGPRTADTLFFGGGTPSLMQSGTVARLIEAVDRLWGFAASAEITLEANPTSAEAERFRAYAAAGVTRLSMGVQALDDADLKALGRMHTAAEAIDAFAIARGAFERVSFDLIYARTGQTVAAWEAELARALALAVDHLSLYQLTIEPGTRFAELYARGRLTVPDGETAAEMYELTQAMTAEAGLPAYEVSNHARAGAECRHNLVYWRYGDYAGAGPGAHGRLTGADGVRRATETHRDPALWRAAVAAEGHGLMDTAPLAPSDQATELLLMGLRLREGVDTRRLARLAHPLDEARIARLTADGLLTRLGPRIAATDRGRLLLDAVLRDLLA